MPTYSKLRDNYLEALEEVISSGLSSADSKAVLLMTRMNDAFDTEKYHHLPSPNERADVRYLDAIFEDINTTLLEAVDLVEAIDAKAKALVEKADDETLRSTVESLRVEFQTRLLRTGGEGVHISDSPFIDPLTLAANSITNMPFSRLDWNNPGAFSHAVLGKVQTMEVDPIVPIAGSDVLFPNVSGATLQVLARNNILSLADLNAAIGDNNIHVTDLNLTQKPMGEVFAGQADASIVLEAELSSPSILSMIRTPIAPGINCHIKLSTLEGNEILYTNVEEVIFVDNPSDLIVSIQWIIPLEGIPTSTLGGFYTGRILTIGDEDNNRQTYAILTDTIANQLGS